MRFAVLLGVVGVACSSGSGASRPAPAPSPLSPAAAAPADPFAALDLGFEASAPAGWRTHVDAGEVSRVADRPHGGQRALQIRGTTVRSFTSVATELELEPYIGKRMRLHGWIRTDRVVGSAALSLRVDGTDEAAVDNLRGHLGETQPWTERTIEVDIRRGAARLVIGASLRGSGAAWFDDLRIEVLDPLPPPKPLTLAGSVVDARGAIVAGAEVALIDASGVIVQHAKTDARGAFTFLATVGRWGLSAHRAGHVGGFLAQAQHDTDVGDLRIALPANGGVTVTGKVVPPPARAQYLVVSPLSNHDADVFAVPVATDGSFSALLPREDSYNVGPLRGLLKLVERRGDRVEVTVTLPAPPSAAISDYIREHAIALATAEPGKGLADMAPLATMIGRARIVALGEATHGMREIFQLKHRFLEYLVEQHGFSLFVIEANQPECRAINDYVLHGKGDARSALAGIYFWTWNTEEVLAMIEWMRAWNAKSPDRQVQFLGNDMQTTTVAHANVAALLEKVAPTRAAALLEPIAVLGARAASDVMKLEQSARARLLAGLAAIGKAFDAERTAWSAATSARELADARHDLVILEQATRMYFAEAQSPVASATVRDLAMADNTAWILDQYPHQRAVLWAHNGHIANKSSFVNMGSHLRKRYKSAYLNFGFVFGEGSFQAMDFTSGFTNGARGLRAFTLPTPPLTHGSTAFARAGKPIHVLDLRALPSRGEVHAWFATAHPYRETGSLFTHERAMTSYAVLPELYDAVIYIDKTSRARPIKR